MSKYYDESQISEKIITYTFRCIGMFSSDEESTDNETKILREEERLKRINRRQRRRRRFHHFVDKEATERSGDGESGERNVRGKIKTNRMSTTNNEDNNMGTEVEDKGRFLVW